MAKTCDVSISLIVNTNAQVEAVHEALRVFMLTVSTLGGGVDPGKVTGSCRHPGHVDFFRMVAGLPVITEGRPL